MAITYIRRNNWTEPVFQVLAEEFPSDRCCGGIRRTTISIWSWHKWLPPFARYFRFLRIADRLHGCLIKASSLVGTFGTLDTPIGTYPGRGPDYDAITSLVPVSLDPFESRYRLQDLTSLIHLYKGY
jgi:hypothetical protein